MELIQQGHWVGRTASEAQTADAGGLVLAHEEPEAATTAAAQRPASALDAAQEAEPAAASDAAAHQVRRHAVEDQAEDQAKGSGASMHRGSILPATFSSLSEHPSLRLLSETAAH